MKSEPNSRPFGAAQGASSLTGPHAPGSYERDEGLDEDLIDVIAVVVAIVLVTMIALAC
jgi:hypothetical protein